MVGEIHRARGKRKERIGINWQEKYVILYRAILDGPSVQRSKERTSNDEESKIRAEELDKLIQKTNIFAEVTDF